MSLGRPFNPRGSIPSQVINSAHTVLQHWFLSRSRLQTAIPRARSLGYGSCLEAPARRKPLRSRFRSIQPTRAISTSHKRSSMAPRRAYHSSGSSSTILWRRFTNLPIQTGRRSCTRETQMGRYSRFISSRYHSAFVAESGSFFSSDLLACSCKVSCNRMLISVIFASQVVEVCQPAV